MSNNKVIYLIYSCDVWKATESMKLVMATASTRKLKSFMSQKIEDEDFEYSDGTPSVPKREAAQFKKDFACLPIREINDRLHCAFIDSCVDGVAL